MKGLKNIVAVYQRTPMSRMWFRINFIFFFAFSRDVSSADESVNVSSKGKIQWLKIVSAYRQLLCGQRKQFPG